MDATDMDVDDENDWKAMDSDEEDAAIHEDDEGVERDDDIDIGFRSHQFQYGRKRKRSRQENQDEAIYGIFNDNNDDRRNRNSNSYSNTAAPMFVPASRSKPDAESAAPMFVSATKKEPDASSSTPAPMFVAATKKTETNSATTDSGLMFVAASSQSKPTEATDTTPPPKDSENDNKEEENDEIRVAQEQKEADDRFMELLEKAKARNKKTRTRPRPLPSSSSAETTMQPNDESAPSGLGMTQGLGLPSSFGGIGSGGGLGFSSPAQEPMEKDPTVGTWEKHTKGFGSKLLAKMGWRGSGGLGSNRRTFRGEAESKSSTTEAAPDASTAPPPAAAAAAKVKKGISRPVEVVVRPNSMGLGFGNFKESSQLKTNRRIEAEVRGIDYDAQLAKEKKEARAKRRQQRKQRYGNQYDSSSSDDEEHGESGNKKNLKSSAIPTTDDLLSNQSWKAKRSKNRKHKSGLPEIIPYQELIQRQKQASNQDADKVVIIDMRGPASTSTASKPTSSTAPIALGEELLYNLSFLLGTYENKLHSSSRHHETSIVRTIEGLDHQIRDAEDRISKAAERRAKLAKAHQIAEAVRTVLQDEASNSQRKRVQALVSELKDVFTPSERKELQFWNVLAPTLLGPTMQSQLENWSPFVANEYNTRDANRAVVDSFFEWAFLGENEGRILCESMVKCQLIPKLKADIESETMGVWDAVTDPYVVLDLYEYIRTKALAFDNKNAMPSSGSLRNGDDDDPNQIFPSNREDDDREDIDEASSSHLAEYIQTTLIREAVYPKLLTAITTWKPNMVAATTNRREELGNPLHTWVLPWLPHIDHPILLPNLLVECKRKLKQSILKLQGKFGNADPQDIIDILRPWCGVLDAKSLQKLLMEEFNFARNYDDYMGYALNGNPKGDKDWKDWRRFLFELHGNQLLSDIDFLSLVEAFMRQWANCIQHFLGGFKALLPLDHGHLSKMFRKNKNADNKLVVEQVLDAYRECKIHVLLDPYYERKEESFPSCARSLELLRNDAFICRSFYGVAKMIQMYVDTKPWRPIDSAGRDRNDEFMNELESFVNNGNGYFNAIRKRRFTEAAEKNRARALGESRGESRAKAVLRKRNIMEPTFREVVEAFAGDRGVIFRPKAGAERDGKPIYLFGNKSIYLEGDVVFYQDDRNKNISWRPISLDQLGAMTS